MNVSKAAKTVNIVVKETAKTVAAVAGATIAVVNAREALRKRNE